MKIHIVKTAKQAVSCSVFSEITPCGLFKIDGKASIYERNAPYKIEIYYPPDD